MIDTAVVQQIGEIAKNVSVAFEGKLNSETLVQITNTCVEPVIKYMYFLQIKDFAINLLWVVGVTVSAFLVAKTIFKVATQEQQAQTHS